MAEYIYHEASGLYVRPDTRDEMIANEVLVEKTYGMAKIRDTDTVLDIGGNIGAAAAFFLDRLVQRVISFEPDPDNAKLFAYNMHKFMMAGFVTLVEAAVTNETGFTTLYTNNGPNKACHSLVEKKGYGAITVQGHSFESVMKSYEPDVIKCDIEGGEYGLPWEIIAKLPYVRVVIIELHTQKPEWRTQHAPALMALMKTIGYDQVTNVSAEFKSSWPKRVIWERMTSEAPAALEA